jgi:hypothetical protein
VSTAPIGLLLSGYSDRSSNLPNKAAIVFTALFDQECVRAFFGFSVVIKYIFFSLKDAMEAAF